MHAVCNDRHNTVRPVYSQRQNWLAEQNRIVCFFMCFCSVAGVLITGCCRWLYPGHFGSFLKKDTVFWRLVLGGVHAGQRGRNPPEQLEFRRVLSIKVVGTKQGLYYQSAQIRNSFCKEFFNVYFETQLAFFNFFKTDTLHDNFYFSLVLEIIFISIMKKKNLLKTLCTSVQHTIKVFITYLFWFFFSNLSVQGG